MSRFGFRAFVNSLLLSTAVLTAGSCSETQASQAITVTPAISTLSDTKPVGQAKLTSDAGLPVRVEYYNIRTDLATMSNRLAVELTKAKGWKLSKNPEMSVFSNASPAGSVKWQRVAVFKGKLDNTLKHVPNSDKEWVNVIIYRVYKG